MFSRIKPILNNTLGVTAFQPQFMLKVTWRNMLPSYKGLDTEVSGVLFKSEVVDVEVDL